MKGYEDEIIKEGDWVIYQHQDKKAWLGPVCVFSIQGKSIFLFSNGSIRKILRCNVQLCQPEQSSPETAASVQDKDKNKDEVKRAVNFNDEDITEKELEEPEKRKTRSMTAMETRELE